MNRKSTTTMPLLCLAWQALVMDIQYVLDALCLCDVCSFIHNEDREINGCVGLKQVAAEARTEEFSTVLGEGGQGRG